MNKILVEVSVGELLDKISILEIKKEKITDQESLKFIEKEYLILKDQLNKNIKYDEKLVGVVIVGRPVARKLDDKLTLEINRNCVLDEAPKGTCSFLYSKAIKVWQSMGGKKIITYTLKSESGSSLKAVNFKKETNVQIFKKNTGWTTRPNRIWQKVQETPRVRWGIEF